MNRPMTVTGLDIGSSKIAAAVTHIDKDGRMDITAFASGEAAGVSRGMLVDLDEAVASVSKVLAKLKGSLPKRGSGIYVNISGQDVAGSRSVGMIPMSLRGREIAAPDVEKSAAAACTIHLPFDKEIIHRVIRSFSIDDQPWIKAPLGLYASRLACEAYVITANVNHIQSIHKCVNEAGYDVREIVFTGMALGAGLLDTATRESGAVIMDIGDSLTEVSVFLGGALEGFRVIGLGSRDAGDDFRSSALFGELISASSAALEDLSRKGAGARQAVLTGGFSLTDGVIEFLEERLSHPVRMGNLRGVRGDISGLDGIRLSAAVGLCRYAYEKKLSVPLGPARRVHAKVVELFNSYF